MTDRHFIGLALLLVGSGGGILLACLSYRVRDVFFVLLVALSPFSELMQVNFFSRDWYRGTSRGIEFCGLDVLAVSLIVSGLCVPRPGQKRAYWPASLGFMILLFLFNAFCVALAEPKLFGLFALTKMIRGVVVFLAAAFFVRSPRELRLLILALGLAVCFEGLQALSQRYLHGIDRVFGTLDDSNSLSMYFCTTAPLFVAAVNARFPWSLKTLASAAIALAFVGVILTISRAGVVAIVLVLAACALATFNYRVTPRRLAMALLIVLAGVGIGAKSWNTLKARFEESSLREEYEQRHSQGRGYYIRLAVAILRDRWFGVGPNNWSYWVTNKYGPRRGWTYVPYLGTDQEPSDVVPSGGNVDEAQAAPAHSLGALTAGETGLGGLFIFTLLWLRWFQMGATFLWKRTPDPMRRLGVGLFFCTLGIFFQSFTEWVFYQTQIYFTFHVLIGTLASLYDFRHEHRSLAPKI
jgi:O-Antigen ligase